ncbi:MAG: hypothetical protein KF850_28110 [Labilithrix sp.]|nr:hypothetical protein [Labilithrix sp.]
MRSLGLLFVLFACNSSEARPERARAPAPSPSRDDTGMSGAAAGDGPAASTASGASPGVAGPAPALVEGRALPAVAATYPWGPTASAPADRLDGRFRAPPPGFARVSVTPGSFAEFLRTLPLQPAGSPVVDFRGQPLYESGRHPNIVAVADIDVGKKDLQHCADAIIRLHAEWRYGRGERDISYRAVSGQPLSYRGYVAGDRAFVDGNKIVLKRAASPKTDDHALFRVWLDDVFSWAGTASLERDGKKVGGAAAMVAGDFFVMSGTPFGHAVLVLDVARDERGRAALLLGQSYMPAQSFQVLAQGGSSWFIVEPGAAAVETPFWKPFPMTSLKRL